MKRKTALLLTTCITASLIFSTVAMAEEGGAYITSTETVYDCDGSGNGYYIYYWSDGSETYEDFVGSSGGSSDDYYEEPSYEDYSYEEPSYEDYSYEEPSYEEPSYEEPSYEETEYEEPTSEEQEQAEAENIEIEYDGIEWTMDQMDSFSDVLTGVDDKEYAVGDASKYDIHKSVNYDSDIVRGVLFNTVNMKGDTAGDYDVMYFIYFDRNALLDYIDQQDLNEEEFPGLTDESSDVIEIGVRGTVAIN